MKGTGSSQGSAPQHEAFSSEVNEMNSDMNEATASALRIFRGEPATLAKLLSLGAQHQRANRMDDARRLFEKALVEHRAEMTDAAAIHLVRDLIVCTYKDPDLPTDTRFDAAEQMLLGILGESSQDASTTLQSAISSLSAALGNFPDLKQDLLGIAGAVEKRRWEVYGLRLHLVRACHYYRRGYEMGLAHDQGYNGINLAFILDLLSQQEEYSLDEGNAARETASEVRKKIIDAFDPSRVLDRDERSSTLELDDSTKSWWLLVTLGEAHLGTGNYERAVQRMAQAAALKAKLADQEEESKHIAPWQLETVARQLVRVAQMQAQRTKGSGVAVESTDAWRAVEALLGHDSQAAQSFLYGKIGLALSGGGFRASLFHIGVLAKLAEMDVLRHVEVLSCVSGGSILGAYYYLELRNLLQTHTDDKISRQEYIELVRRVEKGFVAGVQRNIRLRMLLGWNSNWRVLTSRRSSTSDRLAKLYESELYSRVEDGEQNGARYLADLRIAPLVETRDENGRVTSKKATDFNPRYENWGRLNKIPVLILNSTSLNTCHNWQFTASFMGEPPARSIDAEIDANHRMRRMYHWEAPPSYRRPDRDENEAAGVRLGEAVAASACVPGLFDPLLLEDLYGEMGPEKTKYLMRLVDGGNYDNQGIASLREQDCTVLIISDACGQTGISDDPASDHVGVSMRANNILMARTREVQYQLLSALEENGAIQGLLYLHLKKGLEAQVVDWIGSKDPSTYVKPPVTTAYGIREDVQRLLATVRTDLDSFSWLESDALMLCGYRMAEHEWAKCLPKIPVSTNPREHWDFQKLEPAMTAVDAHQGGQALRDLKKALQVAEGLVFKPFKLHPALKLGGVLMGVAALAAVVWLIVAYWSSSICDAGEGAAIALVCVGVLIALRELLLQRVLHYRNSYLQIAGSILMCCVGWIVFYPYLHWIDPLYVKWGSSYRRP
jgi:predicted acylesterase/phospholipase RssA